MAHDQRRSSRAVKINKDPDFLYDSDSDFLQNKKEISSSPKSSIENFGKDNELNCTDLYDLPLLNRKLAKNNQCLLSGSPVLSEGSGSQSQQQHPNADQLLASGVGCVYSSSDSDSERYRLNSSTRLDYLDFEDCYLSMSPTVHTDSSEMTDLNKGALCACKSGIPAIECCSGASLPKSVPPGDDRATLQSILEAVSKIGLLTDKVNDLEKQIVKQDKIIDELKASSSKESSSSEGSGIRNKSKKNSSSSEYSGTVKAKGEHSKSKKDNVKSKQDRVEEEKSRQLKILQEKIKNKGKKSKESGAESENGTEDDGSSDSEVDLKIMKKKMSKKQKSKCKQRVSSVLKHAGAVFPEDDFETSSSSGTDSGSSSGRKHRRRRKFKSGAVIKKRPVVRTELWPHTIANEEDGDEVTCENISLAKFFSCFTYIMLESSKSEARGRTALLHAVSLVLEALFWTEARTFHNIVMLKIEQGRLDWSTDFTVLAEVYVDKKVRQSFKARNSAGNNAFGRSSYSKSNGNLNYSKNSGRGYGSGNYSKKFSGKDKSLYSSVCKQWNFGFCSYGDKCNRWHVCWSCAEAGKVGENHRASSHDSSGAKFRSSEQRS